jgi:hypothetical protein
MSVFLSVLLLLAQSFSGAGITGVARDKSGAVMPGVTITARNTGTNLVRTALTNEGGVYAIPSLPIGSYEISAELPGFQKQVRSGVPLQVGDNLRINFELEVGQLTDAVTVTGEVPLIQSESAALGTVISNKTVLEMPLNGREFYALLSLAPGTVAPAPGSTLANRGGINMAGARDTSNSYTIDGIDNGSAGTNGPQIKIGVETLQEFKILTNSYSPEYGRGGGGQVIMSTRSGTNEYRGTVWNFLRNDQLDAKNFFDPPDCDKAAPGVTCRPIPPLRRNQFGFVYGGPVPKIKNMFFFAGYEGLRNIKSLTSTATVPIEAFHRGDFSSLLPGTVIRDPVTKVAFPNNIIPQSRWDPVGLALLNLYPTPTNNKASGNLVTNPKAIRNNDQATLRLDYNIGKHNLYARHIHNRELIKEPFPGRGGENGVPGFGWDDPLVGDTFSAGAALVMSPRFIGNVRYGITHMWEPNVNWNIVPFNQQIGLCCTSPDPQFWGRPSISVSGYNGVGDNQATPGGRDEYVNEWNYTQTFLFHNHNYSAGVNIRTVMIDHLLPNARRGNFQFDGLHSGNAVADLLLGVPRQSQLTVDSANFRTHQRGQAYSLFFNDDWKATPNLTLNLGFRYEVNTPMTDATDAIASFNFETGRIVVPDTAKITPGSIAPSFVENSAHGRGLRNSDRNNIAPRIGLAYTVNPKTVLRAGYGVFTDNIAFGNHQTRFVQNSPWFPTKTYRTDAVTGAVINLATSPFPEQVFTQPLLSVNGWDPDFRDGYMQNWNLSVQRQLASDLTAELAYSGSKGTRLLYFNSVNQAFPVGGPLGSGASQTRRLYQAFNNVTKADDIGNSTFHSLQMKLERRFRSGLSLLGTYLWSKSLDNGMNSGQDARNVDAEYGLSSFDVRHRLVTNFVYEIPLGAGHTYLKEGVISHVLGGWQMSGVVTLQSGRPSTIGLTGDRSNTAGGGDRPDAVANPNTGAKTVDSYYNKDAFVLAPANAFGNAGRNTLVGPGMQAFDVALMKNFRFDENRRVQFRTEAFNVLNHPIFGQPGSTFNTADFGTIRSTLVNTTSRQIQLGLKIFF